MADEASFITLLVASERVAQWLDAIRRQSRPGGSLVRVKQALKELIEALQTEAYAEEARKQGAVPLLTGLLKRTEDEDVLNNISDALAACSGLMATSGKVRTFSYGGTPVMLKEGALGDGVGAKVWTVAHTFCRDMASHPEMVRGKRVLEIGAGCGACGILAAKLGAAEVLLTDYVDAVLRNLRDCMHLNAGQQGSSANANANASDGSSADAAANATAAVVAEEAAGWDPEDADECGSDEDFDALLAEAAGGPSAAAGGSSSSCAVHRPAAAAAWDAGPLHVRYYDWEDSVVALEAEAQVTLAAVASSAAAAAGANNPGDSIDHASNDSGAPSMDAHEQYDVIIGTDILYEWPMVEMVPAVLKHRLRPGGRVLLCCAVREQAMFDSFAAALPALGLRVGITHITPQADDAGLLDIRQDYEGGYVMIAAEHADAPADDWHRADLFPEASAV